VQTITVDDVQRFVDALVGRGLSPKSVKGITSALSQIRRSIGATVRSGSRRTVARLVDIAAKGSRAGTDVVA
jgi:hypothetical protein